MSRAFDVLLNETLVGYLSESDTGLISFRFNEEYLEMPDRPVLGQFFEDNLTKIYLGREHRPPAFFSNVIPESGPLRRLVENALNKTDDLSILEFLGEDLPGAVVVQPSNEHLPDISEDFEDSASQDSRLLEEDLGFRFSLAGVQLKFSVIREDERLTLPAHNQHGDWIVKVDSVDYPNLVENEYVIMKWAAASGFNVPECHLQSSEYLSTELQEFSPEDSNMFIIKRYDRSSINRIHQEDFTQVVGLYPEYDNKYRHITYEMLGILIRNIVNEEGFYEFIRRLVFMIASGNTDAHLKNWSLIYPDGTNAQLSPMYDQVFTLAWREKKVSNQVALKFASFNFIKQIDEEAFARLTVRAGMDANKTLKIVRSTLEEICESWLKLDEKQLLPDSHLEELKKFWDDAVLLKNYSNKFNNR